MPYIRIRQDNFKRFGSEGVMAVKITAIMTPIIPKLCSFCKKGYTFESEKMITDKNKTYYFCYDCCNKFIGRKEED